MHGWWFGAGLFGVGVHWVFVSCYRYGNMGMVGAGLTTALLVAYLACFPAFVAWILHRFRRGWLEACLMAPLVWVAAEWLRGWLLTGFPWLNAGNAMIDAPLVGYAPLLGAQGVGLAAAMSGAMLGLVVSGVVRHRLAAALVLLSIWGAGGWLRNFAWSAAAGPPIDVALVQGNIAQLVKWEPGQLRTILDSYLDLTAPHWDADLIVWPENAVPAFAQELPAKWLTRVQGSAVDARATLLTGMPVWDEAAQKYYNALVDIAEPEAGYRKRHLVPFGEYVPLRGLLGGLLDLLQVPMSDFSAGAPAQAPLRVNGYVIGATICYEIAYAREALAALPEAALLVTVSNDTWFGDSIAPHQHLQIARMRAAETGRDLVRATNSGLTAVVDARGEIVRRLPAFTPGVLRAEVTPRVGATPYARFGDVPLLAFGMLTLFVAVRRQGSRQLL